MVQTFTFYCGYVGHRDIRTAKFSAWATKQWRHSILYGIYKYRYAYEYAACVCSDCDWYCDMKFSSEGLTSNSAKFYVWNFPVLGEGEWGYMYMVREVRESILLHSLVPRTFEGGEKKQPGIHWMRMRQHILHSVRILLRKLDPPRVCDNICRLLSRPSTIWQRSEKTALLTSLLCFMVTKGY